MARIFVYPLKSARGFSPPEWPVDRLGFALDRQWLIALPGGSALTQREEPRLALLQPTLAEDHLWVRAPGLEALQVPIRPAADPELLPVRVHEARLLGAAVGAGADSWLAAFLGYPARLVRVREERVVDRRYTSGAEARTGFADAFPFLLLGQGSLDDLNARLTEALPVDRFRPNLLIAGSAPFAEDGWRRIAAGEIELAVVKPCARCVITTTDQETGARSDEPLRTLASYRRAESGKVLFGQNAIHLGTGIIRAGDVVSVLEPG